MIDNDLTPEQRGELGDVQPLVQHLAQYNVPEPDSARLFAASGAVTSSPRSRRRGV